MSATGSYDQVRKYLEGQMKLVRPDRAERTPPATPVFVTISRQVGAGGIALADLVAAKLTDEGLGVPGTPWMVFERNLLQEVIDRHGLPEDYMAYMEESGTPAFRTVIAEMLTLRPPMSQLIRTMNRTVVHLASMGNAVIVGRGASVLTRNLDIGLHVRLVGSAEARAEAISRDQAIPPEQVRRYLDDVDSARAAYLSQHFGRDINDPLLYDLVLVSDRWSPEENALLILQALRTRLARPRR